VLNKRTVSYFLFLLITLVAIPLGTVSLASAAKLTLTWVDTSNSENGFRIERRMGTSGSYQQYAEVAANAVTYTDANVSSATTYCYRVASFNSVGTSGYSNENCATTPVDTFALTVSRAGSGSGTITSSPAGINCSSDCSENYSSGTVITLTATAASGSTFAGWSGQADCADGMVTVNASLNCTATFNVVAAFTLTASVINEISATGTGSGRILSSPAGIDCGSDCAESYTAGKVVTLTPLPAANSKFTGWSGDADCSDGSVTMNAGKTCTAKFALNAVTISVAKKGKGKVASASSGIDCGSACSQSVTAGTPVTLRAAADPGFVFMGWSDGCSGSGDCTVTVSSNTIVTANFSTDLNDKIGIYRPSTGEWFLDRNGSNAWEGCDSDLCVQLFAGSNALPVVGDWNKSGTTKLGLFSSDSLEWFLDANGNGVWDGCQVDICSQTFGVSTDRPVVGQWTKGGEDRIAIFRSSERKWHLDLNGNEILDSCKIDKCAGLSIYLGGDVPVGGDWTGRGTTQLGFFRPSTGEWFLDRNGNRKWNKCKKDLCVASFGAPGDIPVAGDWNGTAKTKIGVFRPSTGEWFLDLDGNGVWDGPNIDLYISGYGQEGDIPVVGRW
jgi:hypothetical protein